MCFVFVFVALLEYAAVNYFFWGARAKKKKKPSNRIPQGNGNTVHEVQSDLSTEFPSEPMLTANGRAPTIEETKVCVWHTIFPNILF